MTEDLVRWLREQLDEDERNAKARRGVFPSPGVDDDGAVWLHIRPGGNAVIVQYRDPVAGYDDMAKLRDWANSGDGWTHERVLLEIAAKRKLLNRWSELQGRIEAETDEVKRGNLALTRHGLDMFVYQLGTIYADRPGYREEWRP